MLARTLFITLMLISWISVSSVSLAFTSLVRWGVCTIRCTLIIRWEMLIFRVFPQYIYHFRRPVPWRFYKMARFFNQNSPHFFILIIREDIYAHPSFNYSPISPPLVLWREQSKFVSLISCSSNCAQILPWPFRRAPQDSLTTRWVSSTNCFFLGCIPSSNLMTSSHAWVK